MPVHIDDINATVQVDSGAQADDASSGGHEPSPQEQARWQAIERRAQALAERTAAWRFDD